ncbi:PEGA domain-containing protein [Candidatus Atribacteria bacterium 1244-E10-H5-B2]|nr:MAG: PEGA domain-containing protein [Candidatus Atribacteria bacterium 1244-E10-H5-B2]
MLRSLLFQKREKIFACVFIALIVFLWLGISGINFAQSPSPGEVEKMKSIQIINPRPTFSLRLWLNKERGATYAPGEKIKISFQVSRDSFVTLYNYDTEGRVKILFPNRYSPHNFVRAGQIHSVEGLIDPRTRPGIEYIQGFATTKPRLLSDREKDLISKEFMPEISKNYRTFTNKIKGIIISMPPTAWTSSNLLSYTVRPTTPPTYYGRIVATSQPQGAKVYLDNVYRGTTPLNLDRVTAGQHQIKLVKTGYRDWSSYVSVSPSRTTTVSADLIPLPVYSSIAIYCNVNGAKIFVNGTYKTATSSSQPKILEEFRERTYEITLIKDGYRTWVEDIWVYAGETTSIYVEMIKIEY